jgi:hypothetical protein
VDVAEDPAGVAAAAAAQAALYARERAKTAGVRRRALRAHTSSLTDRGAEAASASGTDPAIAQVAADQALMQARQRAQQAQARVREGLLRAAVAHERAGEQHERTAQRGGARALEHLRKAAAHRVAAEADRRRYDESADA